MCDDCRGGGRSSRDRLRRVAALVQQGDSGADEGRLEAGGSIVVGKSIVNEGKVVRRSQLIASVRPAMGAPQVRVSSRRT